MKSSKSLFRYFCLACILALVASMPAYEIAHSAPTDPTSTPPNTPLRFVPLSIGQGLSQSVVTVTYQDSQGYLWFGTQDGLNRYDGYHFTIFRPDPDDPSSLSDRIINSIIEDTYGSLC